jgi:hypothetical protein
MDDQITAPVVPLVVTTTAQGYPPELAEPLSRCWPVVLAVGVLFAAVVLVWQAVSVPRYSAYTVIGAAENPGQGSKSSLGGLGGLASVAGISIPGGGGQTSPFDQFKFVLTSPDLAAFQAKQRPMLQIAFSNEWDSERRQWREPQGMRAGFFRWFNPIFGIPASPPIDTRTLAGFYRSKIKIQPVPDTELFRVIFEDPDPARAVMLLDYLSRDANEMLRLRAQATARMQAAYLRDRLARVEVQSYRETLVLLLQQQEQTLMLANGQMPYAAQRVEEINVSSAPTSKQPLLYGTIAFIIGLCIAAFGVILAHNWGRGRGMPATP